MGWGSAEGKRTIPGYRVQTVLAESKWALYDVEPLKRLEGNIPNVRCSPTGFTVSFPTTFKRPCHFSILNVYISDTLKTEIFLVNPEYLLHGMQKKGSENLQITSKKGRILIYLTTSLMDAKVPSSHTLTGQNQKNPGNSMSQEKPLWDLNHVLKFLRPRWKSYWLLGTVVGHLQYQHWKGQDRINLGLRLAQFQWVPSLLGLHIETLSQKIKRKNCRHLVWECCINLFFCSVLCTAMLVNLWISTSALSWCCLASCRNS